MSSLQLTYRETLKDGASLSITFPDIESPVTLLVGGTIDAAVKALKPQQVGQGVDPFYRQQAWTVLQVKTVMDYKLGA